jgi:ABC-type nitrate/sulfonate/bicarbonate transport system substrate-binding protein
MRPIYSIYARPEINDVMGLKGKKVAVSSLGSGNAVPVEEVLKRHGLRAGRDVVVLATGPTSVMLAALQSGTVDAAILTPPYTFQAEQRGFREIVNFPKLDYTEFQGSIAVVEDALRSNLGTVEKFVRGTVKGFRYILANRSATIDIIARREDVTKDLATAMYDRVYRPAMSPDGTLNENLQNILLQKNTERLKIQESPNQRQIFDFSLVRKINNELDTLGWKPQP